MGRPRWRPSRRNRAPIPLTDRQVAFGQGGGNRQSRCHTRPGRHPSWEIPGATKVEVSGGRLPRAKENPQDQFLPSARGCLQPPRVDSTHTTTTTSCFVPTPPEPPACRHPHLCDSIGDLPCGSPSGARAASLSKPKNMLSRHPPPRTTQTLRCFGERKPPRERPPSRTVDRSRPILTSKLVKKN